VSAPFSATFLNSPGDARAHVHQSPRNLNLEGLFEAVMTSKHSPQRNVSERRRHRQLSRRRAPMAPIACSSEINGTSRAATASMRVESALPISFGSRGEAAPGAKCNPPSQPRSGPSLPRLAAGQLDTPRNSSAPLEAPAARGGKRLGFAPQRHAGPAGRFRHAHVLIPLVRFRKRLVTRYRSSIARCYLRCPPWG
jgi:hypothetical protein